ncbi:MAG: hypothetical protein KY456_12455 [Chloroflexi bacterium]|nr:hypothetical protein [Chloroflexota bacterium]
MVLGLLLLLDGLKNETQFFDLIGLGTNATMLVPAVISLGIPAVLALGPLQVRPSEQNISFPREGLAVVLIVIYMLYVLFLLTQVSRVADLRSEHGPPSMKLRAASGPMAVTTIGIIFMSELLVGAVEPVAEQWGLFDLFIGAMLVPLVGYIAEHIVAVQTAY